MVNSLHICEDFYLLIYETKEDAEQVVIESRSRGLPFGGATECRANVAGNIHVTITARIWSIKIKSRVTFSNPGDLIFLIKKEEDKFWNVIVEERVGWIIVYDWMNIKMIDTGT